MHRKLLSIALCAFATSFSLTALAAGVDPSSEYKETKLVSNIAGQAAVHDPNLVNPWGLARSTGGPWWIGDNGTGLSTLYDGTGAIQNLVVTIPPSDPKVTPGSPTGTVFNGDPNAFQLSKGNPAFFIFVSEDGTISGWNPGVNLKAAQLVVNEKAKSVFKGATIAKATIGGHTGSFLYVADFRQARVRIFDADFKDAGWFGDLDDNDKDAGFAPFNVQNIGNELFVTYAIQNAVKHDQVDGAGNGFVRVYSPNGTLIRQFERGAFLNSPWGVALAPGDFGAFSHNILVGQFGSGEIVAYDAFTGRFRGTLRDSTGKNLVIDRLWSISTGDDGAEGPATTVFFTAGPNHEQDGLFGSLSAINNPQGNHQ